MPHWHLRPGAGGPRGVALCLAVVITSAIGGCGGSGASTAPGQVTPSPSSAAPSSSATCPPATAALAPPPGGVGIYNRTAPQGIAGATSTLTLCADGQYTQDVGVTGRWAYAGGRITFTEASDTACAGVPGTYDWGYDGVPLTLKVVSDACGLRAEDFPAAPWTKGS